MGDILFVISWFILLILGIRLMANGWGLMTQKPIRMYDDGYNPMKGGNNIHPEMRDVKEGDELMVVKFGDEEPQDPLYKSLGDRIQSLEQDNVEDEDDDDDNSGGLVVRQ
jgi:hypothetical protein